MSGEQIIRIDYTEHEIGNEDCTMCWDGYPVPCECGGLIHGELEEYGVAGDPLIYTKCDKCGQCE